MANQLVVKAANVIGAALLDDTEQYRYRMEIKSETSTRLYVVAQRRSTGEWSCSCPGWIFGNRHCKHLDAMLPALIQLPASDELKKLGSK